MFGKPCPHILPVPQGLYRLRRDAPGRPACGRLDGAAGGVGDRDGTIFHLIRGAASRARAPGSHSCRWPGVCPPRRVPAPFLSRRFLCRPTTLQSP